MRIWDLSIDDCDESSPILVDFDTGQPIGVYLQGPPGPAGGELVETLTADIIVNLDAVTEFLVINSLSDVEVLMPLAASRISNASGLQTALPITIKNTTGVNVTLVPSGSDTLEVSQVNFKSQSLTLLPIAGGYISI